MSTTKKTVIVIIGIILWALALWALIASIQSYSSKNKNTLVSLEIVDTQAERDQGLSGRENLPKDHGMLFVFDRTDIYKFWMKDMKFSIDMIFLDENFHIVSIEKNVSPDTFPQTFQPSVPIKYVLECATGFAERHRLKVGDRLAPYLML
ncbi:MAG: hypothetical protein K0S38_432 [Candidatus Paceibacter sp.]|jgi:uncharacterized membrane protein (UPF0127 family)|nr:hypothetical protein [Candidatus Paceibacter sp.]